MTKETTNAFKLKDVKTIEKQIATINKNGKKFDMVVHETAVQTLMHAKEHGDLRLASRLYQVMPRSARGEALKFWFETYGPLKYQKTEEGNQFKKDQSDSANVFDIEGAIETPFWDLVPETIPQSISLDKLKKSIQQSLSKAIKKAENGEVDGDAKEIIEYALSVQEELFPSTAT